MITKHISFKTLLKESSAKDLRKVFESVYSKVKYKNKKDAINRLSRKRFSKKEAARLKITNKQYTVIHYILNKRKIVKVKVKPKIIFELGYESKNYYYYRTEWLPISFDDFWSTYGEAVQDFVEKHTKSLFVGFRYESSRTIGELSYRTDNLFEFSHHFLYEDFFGKNYFATMEFDSEDLSNVALWVMHVFGVSLMRKVDRYRDDAIYLTHFYIVERKE